MKLIPHLYAAFMNYYETGIPPVRPLVMDFPEDAATKDIYDQFMLGEGLMAAPLIANTGDSRRVYFPAGTWYELKTGKKIEGGQWLEIAPALDEIPLYVQAGTLLVLAKPVEYVGDQEHYELDVTAYGEAECSCRLACDDGASANLPVDMVPWLTLHASDSELAIENEDKLYSISSFKRVV